MKTVRLNNDVIMPMVGYGTYQIPAAKTRDNVLQALRTGYRLIARLSTTGMRTGSVRLCRRAACRATRCL